MRMSTILVKRIIVFIIVILGIMISSVIFFSKRATIIDIFENNTAVFVKIVNGIEFSENEKKIYLDNIMQESDSIREELNIVFNKYNIDSIYVKNRQVFFNEYSGQYALVYSPYCDLVQNTEYMYSYTSVENWYSFFLNQV